jgi:uncharacterized protein DUF3592
MKEGTNLSAKGARWLDALALVQLAFALIVAGMLVQTCRIMANPETAIGIVESKKMTRGDSENPDVFDLRYTFEATVGATYHGTASVTKEIYDETSVGDTVTVQYADDDPGNNRLISETGDPRNFEFAALAIMGFFVFVYFGPRRWLALRRGEPDPVLER